MRLEPPFGGNIKYKLSATWVDSILNTAGITVHLLIP